MHVAAIIAAGGRGARLGAGRPKQLLELGGRTMLERSLDPFLELDLVRELVVALPAELASRPPEYLRAAAKPLRIVAGGPTRQASVASAFEAVSADADVLVIHDAARPFVTRALIVSTIEAAAEHGAALAAVRASDTIREVAAGTGRVVRTLERDAIYLAQTPQAFRRDVLRDAIALGRTGHAGTDEAALAERAGHAVRLVEGDPRNIKITTEADLTIARALVAPPALAMRVGTGYDLHRLVPGRPLVLGGVTLPFDRGLAGHSDADAVCHAVADAILGAAGAGNLGRLFPDTDPRWKDVVSTDLLREAARLVREAGFLVENLDVVIIAERPRIEPHAEAMCAALAGALGIEAASISVKGKTNEGVGEIGRGEAIAVHAVALLQAVGSKQPTAY